MIKLRIIGTKRLAPTNYLEAQAWLRQRDTEMV
jgi:hypothetical protein